MNTLLSICGIVGGFVSIITVLGYSKSIIKYLKFIRVKAKILKFFKKYEVAITKLYLMEFLNLTSYDKENVDEVLKHLKFRNVELYKLGDDMYINKKSANAKSKLVGYCIDSEDMYERFLLDKEKYINK